MLYCIVICNVIICTKCTDLSTHSQEQFDQRQIGFTQRLKATTVRLLLPLQLLLLRLTTEFTSTLSLLIRRHTKEEEEEHRTETTKELSSENPRLWKWPDWENPRARGRYVSSWCDGEQLLILNGRLLGLKKCYFLSHFIHRYRKNKIQIRTLKNADHS